MGSYQSDDALYRVMATSNMLFVCAAGNDGVDMEETPIYPGSYRLSNVICVANMTQNGTLYAGSNYSSTYVDIAAPGTSICSTIAGGMYGKMTGTSMAAPFVSGVAALLHSYYGGITAAQIKDLIMQTASTSSALVGKTSGGGFLNAYWPLIAYDQDAFLPDETPPTVYTTVSDLQSTYRQLLTITVTDNSEDAVRVKYARGSHNAAWFRAGNGYDLSLDEEDTVTRKMAIPGTYTVYAADVFGNETVTEVTCTADAVKSVKLNYSKKTLAKGKKLTLKATLSKSGTYGRSLTWTSSNTKVATVSKTGKVTAKKKGTTTITVKTANGLTAKCKITVK
jgi:subtilisin family serine protease